MMMRCVLCLVWLAPAAALWPRAALAHGGQPLAPHDLWGAWESAPLLVLALAGLALVYLQAVANLWHAAGRGRGVGPWRLAAFLGGLALLGLALLSPIDALGGVLFSAHMVQHVLLMMAAAPLLAAGAPAHIWLWALPLAARRRLGRGWGRLAFVGRLLHLLRLPLVVWLASALVMWLWHAPALYEAALQDDAIHQLEHGLFLGSAWLFWAEVVRRPSSRGLGDARAVLLLFTTALHSSMLGVLITFSPTPWYATYDGTTAAWGLTPLADQQLAGVIMWVPAGMVYLGATLALIGARLAQLERRDALPVLRTRAGTMAQMEEQR